MIAESSDIKFACSQCGQRIVVEKSAAGMTGTCPICEGPVTVPHASSVHDRHVEIEVPSHDRTSFADPGLEDSRDELFSSSVELGQAQRELDEANKEIERLRALFKKSVDECERITASATHAQAEIKSFQTDRQQLKADLSTAKQRALAAEGQAAELADALATATHENAALQQQLEQHVALGQDNLSAVETQLDLRERELAAAHAENSEIVQSLAAGQAELASMQAELTGLRDDLGTAQQMLEEAANAEGRLVTAKHELESQLAEAKAAGLQFCQERDQLRLDLVKTDTGAELLDLRGRLADLTEDRAHMADTLAEKRAEVKSLTETEHGLREELQTAIRLREEAERLAAANSESQMNKDNEVLRGIVARQNTTLGVYYSEVRRMRRGRFGLRIVYGLFGVALIGLVIFALSIFTHQGVAGLFNRLVH